MEFVSRNKTALVQLVQQCLSENSRGVIERQQFIDFCADLSVSVDELDSVFNELDSDGDGKIDVNDFTSSFEQVTNLLGKVGESNGMSRLSEGCLDYEGHASAIDSPMQVISGQQYISELYYNLRSSSQPDLLELFEKHLANVVKDIKARAAENQRLEEALKRATKQHARQVHNLDREVEQQMEKLEAKVRQEEKSTYEKKLSDIEWQIESKDKEISGMSKTIETLQTRLNKELNKPNTRNEEVDNVIQENRYLKSQVTDSQTSLALLRSELAELKSQFVEQSEHLKKERRTAEDYLHEQQNLARQVQLLHDANQRLQDVNDELRGALEARRCSSPEKRSVDPLSLSAASLDPGRDLSSSVRSSGLARSCSATPLLGSRHSDCAGADLNDNTLNDDSLFSELHRASTPCKSDLDDDDEAYGTLSKSRKADVQKQIQILEDTNKRLSSSNDELRVALKIMTRSNSFRKSKKGCSGNRRTPSSNSDYGSLSSRSSRGFSPHHKRLSNGDVGEATDESTTYDVEDDENVGIVSDSTATMNSETVADLEAQLLKINDSQGRTQKSEDDDDEDDDEDRMDSAELAELVAMASDVTDVTDSGSEQGQTKGRQSQNEDSPDRKRREEISTMTSDSLSMSVGTPERMYKLVLAGDAAVGKSSFILRLCKNRFHSSLNATLGVDFQVKNIKVDSKTIALQLWDTAGQERFRSIAKSYFRKVDGILLLYDVTCESSFVNVRDWMTTIEESSHKKVPIMLCGNKCDLRSHYVMEGKRVVSTESGQRLAKHYDALFIETSAKDGKHIEEACEELARILTSIENEEIEQSGLRLDRNEKKKKKTCCRS